MNLKIYIEMNSEMICCGEITDARFSYSKDYLNANLKAISVSLPLQSESFSEEQSKSFFDGLLPEGFPRRTLASNLHTSESDYLRIISELGRECLGAIQIRGEQPAEKAAYKKISLDDVKALASEGATRSVAVLMKSHLSLAGASGKVGLYYDEIDDSWYQPFGTAPSTHIVKQSHVRYAGIVVNELLCQKTARRCGITTPESFIIKPFDDYNENILFVTKRYDRVMNNDKHIEKLPCPKRLHQEDFAQALGIPSINKYEPLQESYLKKCFELIKNNSQYPFEDEEKFWDIVMFNYLIGNNDAHLKNFSMLYNDKLSTVRLAPAYDLVSTAIYTGTTRNLSMRIGNARSIDQVDTNNIKLAAIEIGLGEKKAIERFERLIDILPKALDESADEICSMGYSLADEIKNKIKIFGGIKEAL